MGRAREKECVMGLHLVTGFKGEAHITSADQGAFNAGMIGNGEYVMETGKKFAVSVISNNKIRVYDGDLVMQGRHVTLKKDVYEELEIANGLQGMNRNDLIVARYTKDAATGFENVIFDVIQGISTESSAQDPEYTSGDLSGGECLINEMPLYRVQLSGLSITGVTPLFKTMTAISELETQINGLSFMTLTQEEYNILTTKDARTVYLVI